MADTFPSRFEMKLSGCSLLCSQIMLCIATFIYSIDDDVYEVRSEEEVIEMHNILSSAAKRREVEICCGIMWFTFPLMLIALYGIKKVTTSVYGGTSAEVLIYLAEKSYIMYIAVICIIIPAMMYVHALYLYTHSQSIFPMDHISPSSFPLRAPLWLKRLVTVAYEWSFHEYTPDDDFTATGYYVQVRSISLFNE